MPMQLIVPPKGCLRAWDFADRLHKGKVSDAEMAHIDSCPDCGRLFDWAKFVPWTPEQFVKN